MGPTIANSADSSLADTEKCRPHEVIAPYAYEQKLELSRSHKMHASALVNEISDRRWKNCVGEWKLVHPAGLEPATF